MFLPAVAFLGSHCITRVADQGLANFLGLVTLRHGTNPISWLGIHTFGALPVMGDSRIGGDYGEGCSYQNKSRFYFAQDSDYYTPQYYIKWSRFPLNKITMRLIPKAYSFTSTLNLFGSIGLKSQYKIVNFVLGIWGPILPTTKFRLQTRNVENLYPDPTHGYNSACSTDQWHSPLNIGLCGTIWNSLTYRTPIQMFQNPLRVITGIATLALCGVAAYHIALAFPAFVATYKTALIAGAFFAVI